MVQVHDALRERARLRGVEWWLDELSRLVADLERDWDLIVGEAFPTGTEAYVARANLADGTRAVLKILLPWPDGPTDHEAAVLRLAGGHGCVRLLRHDPVRSALLLDELGPSLDRLGLPTERRVEIMCDTLPALWAAARTRAPEVHGLGLPSGADKATWLAGYITDLWERLDRPCRRAAVDHALACADQRRRAHDERRATLVHGDVHQWNTLCHPDGGFRFVDPDGLVAEAEYDLGVMLREDPDEPDDPMRGDPQARARWLADRTGLDERAIWQWGVVERVSTGLSTVAIGLQAVGHQMLALADRIAE